MRFARFAIIFCSVLPVLAQYAARQNGDVVRLEDAKSQTVVSIVTSVGNEAFEMKVKGQNVLFFPYASLDDFKSRPMLSGIPFLGPWANRLDEPAFTRTASDTPSTWTLETYVGHTRFTAFSPPPINGR